MDRAEWTQPVKIQLVYEFAIFVVWGMNGLLVWFDEQN
jgi:hypothetical protein